MSVSAHIEGLIANSFKVSACKSPIAYDENHPISYGYWICTACKNGFYAGGKQLHGKDCSLKERIQDWNNENFVYVMGPSESGLSAPFDQNELEKIKEIAKSRKIAPEHKS